MNAWIMGQLWAVCHQLVKVIHPKMFESLVELVVHFAIKI